MHALGSISRLKVARKEAGFSWQERKTNELSRGELLALQEGGGGGAWWPEGSNGPCRAGTVSAGAHRGEGRGPGREAEPVEGLGSLGRAGS